MCVCVCVHTNDSSQSIRSRPCPWTLERLGHGGAPSVRLLRASSIVFFHCERSCSYLVLLDVGLRRDATVGGVLLTPSILGLRGKAVSPSRSPSRDLRGTKRALRRIHKMKALVLGAAGGCGAPCLLRLLERGVEVKRQKTLPPAAACRDAASDAITAWSSNRQICPAPPAAS